MSTQEEIAQNQQFLLLSPCIQLYSIIALSFKGNFLLCGSLCQKLVLRMKDPKSGIILNFPNNHLLVAGQKLATSIFNRFNEITWEGGLLLERNTFRCLEHITIVFV